MLKSFKNGVFLGIGFVLILGVVFASAVSINSISDKGQNGMVSFNEFNQILGTIKNIYNDDDNKRIGINQPNPQATLDVIGNIRISSINNCGKLGTDSDGKLICK